MTDKSANNPAQAPSSYENMEQYRLHSRNEISTKLRLLARARTLATVFFDHGSKSLITTIIEVIADKDLVVLDYGRDEAINNRLLQASNVVIKTIHDGVTCQFTTNTIKKAKLQGQPVFACSMPDSIIWLQRRETFRARIPLGAANTTCTLTREDGSAATYKLLDISTTGLALHDEATEEQFVAEKKFTSCKLSLGEHGNGIVNLAVKNILPVNKDNPRLGRRIGCVFINLTTDIDAMIQRYIHFIETQRRRVDE